MNKRTFLKTVIGAAATTVVPLPAPPVKETLSPWFNFPLISRMSADMITADILAVQPMTPVDGALFTIKTSYGRTPFRKPPWRVSRMADLLEHTVKVRTPNRSNL